MKVLKPFYYDDFKCIANECIDNCCCENWNIFIDKNTYNKYKKTKGKFGKIINSNITRKRKNSSDLAYGKIKLKNNKCAMLSEENLCSVYINLGEEYLCNTCKIYPRQIKQYGEFYERNLYMSCPVVASYLVNHKEDFYFNMDEESTVDLEKEIILYAKNDENLYQCLWEARSFAMEIIQFKEIELWKRIVFTKMLCDKSQNLINENNYENFDVVLNSLRNEITNIDVINSLDKISIVPEVKVKFIQGVLQARYNFGINNEKYFNLLKEYNEFFEGDNEFTSDYELLVNKEKEFNEYLKLKENVFENLLIYLIYKYFMGSLNTKDLNSEVNNVIISYVVIKMLLLARWNKNNKELDEEDFVEVFYVFARVVEHNSNFFNELNKKLKTSGYGSIAYITILVR